MGSPDYYILAFDLLMLLLEGLEAFITSPDISVNLSGLKPNRAENQKAHDKTFT